MSAEVVIADTGGANVASLCFAFERLGAVSRVTADGATIASAERVVLPGVGAADHAMERLRAAGLINVLRTLTQPVLGICLGMQLLFQQSDEGATRCLSVLPGVVHGLAALPGRPVPHMGWNEVRRLKADPLLQGIADRAYAYFVHSFAAGISEVTLASTEYGSALSAVVRRGNFYGAQFHPERSGKTGARLLQNFLSL
ncbi:MAG TPA: imidazole glycerol phosphate synthase subunit HisH [Steroidobacteraceae bacterium]|nr:imidazole glycerol phosphate synthase subunit HisH [Steroidobacteraceae bacterium]HEV2443317.1 imidazole glycerol phosphate synthase subunit HisH [Steroidobacteraceae bacterium]